LKIAIIGSTQYKDKMQKHCDDLKAKGNPALMPVFDGSLQEYKCCSRNRTNIEWADEIHVFWDARSIGTIFDLGMCFALRKRIKLMYLNPKTLINFVNQYEKMGK
jgi:hypothetical protein